MSVVQSLLLALGVAYLLHGQTVLTHFFVHQHARVP